MLDVHPDSNHQQTCLRVASHASLWAAGSKIQHHWAAHVARLRDMACSCQHLMMLEH